jgi:carboxymethylenebutenolidase
MRKLDAELTKFGKAHEFHTYAGAAHAFVNTGSSNYRPRAAALSWPKAMEFFSRHLVDGGSGALR